jgi:hypothetical protein
MEAFGKKVFGGWVLATLFLVAGCHTTEPPKEEFTMEPVHQINVIWSNQLSVTSNFGSDFGADLPGVIGSLYLMGPDSGHTVKSNGRVVVDAFEAGKSGTKGEAKFLGRWQISKENLARLGVKDTIGLRYVLFLPWPAEYDPNGSKIQLQVTYIPDEGPTRVTPRYAVNFTRDEFKSVVTRVRPQGVPAPTNPPQVTEESPASNTVLVTTQEGK